MDKQTIRAYFDKLAPNWDESLVHDDRKIARILDYADVRAGHRVLDVACGTGVLTPDYLAREVGLVVGVDIAPGMIEAARAKFCDPRVTFLCADAETEKFDAPFDRCVVYNAFPHFPHPEALFDALAEDIVPGGRLTVAHGMSRAQLDAHHAGSAQSVSRGLLPASELSALMGARFSVDIAVEDDEIYVVSGVKRS